MNHVLHPITYVPRIGIVGGGQLGKMLVQSAKKLGFYTIVIDPTPQSPAGQVADKQIVADYKDEKAIRQLGEESDYITFEVELANDKALNDLLKQGKKVNPSPQTLGIIRDKLKQKEFLHSVKIPTAEFIELSSIPLTLALSHKGRGKIPSPLRGEGKDEGEQLRITEHELLKENIKQAAKRFGYPLLLKARTDAYDGRGNALIKNEKDIDKGLEKLKINRINFHPEERSDVGSLNLYVEKFVPFIKELAVMVARNTTGQIEVYPVVETIHKDNICDTVLCPAKVSKKAFNNAQKLAKKVMQQLQGAGVFGIEMFLVKGDNVLVNEIAPRVHNSGHHTIEATVTSQFEQHIRAIADLPLGDTMLLVKAAVMKNILGEKNGPGFPSGINKALEIPGVSLHLYGKHQSRPQRKMGHITVVGNTIEECLRKANKARKALVI